jgi:hypothetical protein
MAMLVRELGHAPRAPATRPGFAAVAVFTPALGIGATVAIFTVVNSVLLRPLSFPDSEQIVTVRHHAPGIGLPELHASPWLDPARSTGPRRFPALRRLSFSPKRCDGRGWGARLESSARGSISRGRRPRSSA